jgi:ArsR family transcriptional regulator, virulence genes transcriptional regulator
MAKDKMTSTILRKCDSVSRIMRSLSHPVRLKILCCVLEREQGVNELADFCGTSQSAMSQFLKRMKSEGTLTSRREHNFVYYSLSDMKLIHLLRAVRKIYC